MVSTIDLLLDSESILYDLSMKEGSLFCTYEIHQTEMLQIVFLIFYWIVNLSCMIYL
jgi:hypothetical protein